MEAIKHWKIVLSLAAIFLAGAVTGGVITFQVVRSVVRARTNPDQWSARILRDYQDRLDLSQEQMDRIRPVLLQAGQQMKQARGEFIQLHGRLMREVNATLTQELTPVQKQIFEELREEQVRRFRERGVNPGKRPFPSVGRPPWMRQEGPPEGGDRKREGAGTTTPPSQNSASPDPEE